MTRTPAGNTGRRRPPGPLTTAVSGGILAGMLWHVADRSTRQRADRDAGRGAGLTQRAAALDATVTAPVPLADPDRPARGLFDRLGRTVTRHPWTYLTLWLLIAALAGGGTFLGFGQGGLFHRMTNSVSLVSGSESDTVNQLTTGATDHQTITIVVAGLDIPAQRADLATFMAGQDAALAAVDGVSQVVDPFQLAVAPDPAMAAQAQAMFSDKQDGFLVSVTLDFADGKPAPDTQRANLTTAVDAMDAALVDRFPGASATPVTQQLMGDAILGQVQSDLVTGEAVSLPVALLLLLVVFGGVVAAGLPLAGAVLSIIVGLGAVWGLTFVLNVDSFILNIITIIGLALSIDYGLLVVSRYREELADCLVQAGYPADGSVVPDKATSRVIVRAATRATIATAGRTVAFSAVTIACAMSALLVMQSDLLKTIGTAGIAVTLLAVLMALMVVPALIVIANRVLIQPSILTRIPGVRTVTKAVGDASSDTGVFSRLARRVHAHPWIVLAAVLLILGVMVSPIRSFALRTVFADYLPAGNVTTQAYQRIQSDYPAARAASIVVIADVPPTQAGPLHQHLESLPQADFVSPPTALASDAGRSLLDVHLSYDNQVGTEVTDQVTALRAYDPGYPMLVGGPAALQKDFIDSVLNAAPLALAIMAAAVLVLLFLMTGSLIVPLKALIINSLSLVASLGATSWIFMHGYFGMPKLLGIETIIAACFICFGFGLAMDYEVFLLARIKEAWDAGVPNDRAVELGLQRSGRIITSAAAIIVAVFVGFSFGQMIAIKQIGVALAVTVVADATLVRMLLVPATMTILGKWNWWAPRPLKALYNKLGFLH